MRRHSTLDTATADSHSVPPRTAALDNMEQQEGAVLPRRSVFAKGMDGVDLEMQVVKLIDRRATPPSDPTDWMLQTELEDLLYPSVMTTGTNGAFYRLLERANVAKGSALPLRRNSIDAGLVTGGEFIELKGLFHQQVRAFTLVPLDAVSAALACYGSTSASESLIAALGLPRPAEWPEAEAVEEEASDDGDGGGGGDDEGGGGSQGSDGSQSGGGGVDDRTTHHATTSHMAEEDDADTAPDAPATSGKRKRATFTPTPALDAELAAFERFRTSEVNRERRGKKVKAVTAADDVRRTLAFLSYLLNEKGHQAKGLRLFASPQIGAVVQDYVNFKTTTCEYSSIAKTVGSLVAVARYTLAALKAQGSSTTVNQTPLNELVALHTQCLSEGRQQSQFSVAKPPQNWLDWSECNAARLAAEKALARYNGSGTTKRLGLIRDACLLKLLTAMVPDRVGVYRLLKMGATLKRVGDGFDVDLSAPDSHKTQAFFGPTCHSVTTGVAARLVQLVEADSLVSGEYLFHGADRRAPLCPIGWCRLVKKTFKKYSARHVGLCPKDCRSSFVTWLKDGGHGDDVLASAAKAMRHSSKVADSAAYDKHKSDRMFSAAMKVAEAFANSFD